MMLVVSLACFMIAFEMDDSRRRRVLAYIGFLFALFAFLEWL